MKASVTKLSWPASLYYLTSSAVIPNNSLAYLSKRSTYMVPVESEIFIEVFSNLKQKIEKSMQSKGVISIFH